MPAVKEESESNPAQQGSNITKQGNEGDSQSSDDAEAQGYFEIFDDGPPSPSCCLICGKQLPPNGLNGYNLCETCEPHSKYDSMALYTNAAYRYGIDNRGIIWHGLPDEPEPVTSIQDLPIYAEHPQKENFRRFPLTNFLDQLDYPQNVGGSYNCFVCGQDHIFPPVSSC